ncbi:hypothetical protein CYLTODRAFT_189463 [Cylindrobasidium torrendii FP15055 ss-10]|uniref:Uncharacterized protein n=1 Tax=Cylindrobasidium torrendii FP15055 ss-10 TaxID=1314674 RepID=A0A0D7AV09_9AGAR|nr:hypothetical protein CYLTODRAFT_189463 [Cylindrobasidium torrendii FP15055 ss-10]
MYTLRRDNQQSFGVAGQQAGPLISVPKPPSRSQPHRSHRHPTTSNTRLFNKQSYHIGIVPSTHNTRSSSNNPHRYEQYITAPSLEVSGRTSCRILRSLCSAHDTRDLRIADWQACQLPASSCSVVSLRKVIRNQRWEFVVVVVVVVCVR